MSDIKLTDEQCHKNEKPSSDLEEGFSFYMISTS